MLYECEVIQQWVAVVIKKELDKIESTLSEAENLEVGSIFCKIEN